MIFRLGNKKVINLVTQPIAYVAQWKIIGFWATVCMYLGLIIVLISLVMKCRAGTWRK